MRAGSMNVVTIVRQTPLRASASRRVIMRLTVRHITLAQRGTLRETSNFS